MFSLIWIDCCWILKIFMSLFFVYNSAQYGKKLSAQVRIKILESTTYNMSCEICVQDLDLPVTINHFMEQFYIFIIERTSTKCQIYARC